MRRLWLAGCLLAVAACASPADMAKDDLGSSRCAKQAEKKCEGQLAGSDQQACMKRELYMCEEVSKPTE
ncbi:MAG TPA: hypothetical protein VMR31_12760 [Myxococcota bacterium]|nr:hypothetical protein [Myxococcota bacterium]